MAYTKEEAINEFDKLISEYDKYKDNKEFTSNEKQICESLIKPFIKRVLGWNTEDFSEFKVEYPERGKRIDILICLDGVSQFVIEAKKLSKSIINNREFYSQAIDYAHSKDKSFAILTNFKEWIVLRCDIKVSFPEQAVIGIIDFTNFQDDRFTKLVWNFNKDVWVEKGDSNPLYSEFKQLKRKIPIDEQLLDDMKKWRLSLLTNLRKYPKKNHFDFDNEKDIMHIEEEIQRFIDRLIFICYCEDKQLGESKLKSLKIDKYKRFNGKPFLLAKIRETFHQYWKDYNSDLFVVGMCDGFFFDDSVLYQILEDLREPKGKMPYNFATIEVDILGKTYENFIGHLIKGKKRFKEEKSKGKRKEEGIYYTSQNIVNYIVDNTIRDYIKNMNYEEIKKVKILDPACGSGSFLIRIFDVLVEECTNKLKRDLSYEEKQSLLLNCIYGVDKDERACDIAKLSLSLKLAEKGKKLPELHNNIRNGDSLIDDESIADYLNFKWEQEFRDIMQNGMFDIIMGNPPYGADLSKEELNYLKSNKNFITAKIKNYDTYIFFIEKSLSLLKENGVFSFIVPDTFLRKVDLFHLRKLVLSNFRIKQIIETGSLFEDAKATENTIFVFKKKMKQDKDKFIHAILDKSKSRDERLNLLSINKWSISGAIEQQSWENTNSSRLGYFIDKQKIKIIEKIESSGTKLVNIPDFIISRGSEGGKNLISDKIINNSYKPIIIPDDVSKYFYEFNNRYFPIKDKSLYKYEQEKLLIIRIKNTKLPERLTVCFDNKKIYCLKTLQIINLKEGSKYNLKYLLTVLNSNLINFYCKNFLSDDMNKKYLELIPIVELNHSNKIYIEELINVVNKIMEVKKKLTNLKNKSSAEFSKLNKDFDNLNKDINRKVYSLYGITKKEKEIIENSV